MNIRTADPLFRDMAYVGCAICSVILCIAFYSWRVDYVQDDGGFPAVLVEKLPEDQAPLRDLATSLSEHNQQAHKAIKQEFGVTRSLGWAKQNHPEKFLVPYTWYESVAASKEIPRSQIESLIRLLEEKPLSTDDAANWLHETSHVISSPPHQATVKSDLQRQAIDALQRSVENLKTQE